MTRTLHIQIHRSGAPWFLMFTALAACASDNGSAATAGASETTAGANAPATSSAPEQADGFEVKVQPFVNTACNCHQSSPLMAPFSLKPGEAYQNLVNVPSGQLPSMLLVKPSSTQDSYLWHKINNTHLQVGGTGQVMPSTIPLSAEEKKIFERWILGGAPR